MTTNLLIN